MVARRGAADHPRQSGGGRADVTKLKCPRGVSFNEFFFFIEESVGRDGGRGGPCHHGEGIEAVAPTLGFLKNGGVRAHWPDK